MQAFVYVDLKGRFKLIFLTNTFSLYQWMGQPHWVGRGDQEAVLDKFKMAWR